MLAPGGFSLSPRQLPVRASACAFISSSLSALRPEAGLDGEFLLPKCQHSDKKALEEVGREHAGDTCGQSVGPTEEVVHTPCSLSCSICPAADSTLSVKFNPRESDCGHTRRCVSLDGELLGHTLSYIHLCISPQSPLCPQPSKPWQWFSGSLSKAEL